MNLYIFDFSLIISEGSVSWFLPVELSCSLSLFRSSLFSNWDDFFQWNIPLVRIKLAWFVNLGTFDLWSLYSSSLKCHQKLAVFKFMDISLLHLIIINPEGINLALLLVHMSCLWFWHVLCQIIVATCPTCPVSEDHVTWLKRWSTEFFFTIHWLYNLII